MGEGSRGLRLINPALCRCRKFRARYPLSPQQLTRSRHEVNRAIRFWACSSPLPLNSWGGVPELSSVVTPARAPSEGGCP
jgi:hypothetical protein